MKIVPGGDATRPEGDGNKFIIHICNDLGAWGAGFVIAISRRWRTPEQAYRSLKDRGYELGTAQIIPVEPGLSVVNMIAQHGVGGTPANPPIRLDALRQCLTYVAAKAKEENASVHLPPIGCGLAMGSWEDIGLIIQEELVNKGIDVTVYDRDGILG